MHAHVQPHPFPRLSVNLENGCWAIHAGGLRVGVHNPILRHVVTDDEQGWLVGWVLDDVFLLGNPDKKPGTLTIGDLFFDVMGSQHAFEMTNGFVAKGAIMVAENQGVGLRLDEARSVNDDLQTRCLILGVPRPRGDKRDGKSETKWGEGLYACHVRRVTRIQRFHVNSVMPSAR
jgi:hypothetical protein